MLSSSARSGLSARRRGRGPKRRRKGPVTMPAPAHAASETQVRRVGYAHFTSNNTPPGARRSGRACACYSDRRSPTPSSRVQTAAGSASPKSASVSWANGLLATPRLPETSRPSFLVIGATSVTATAPPRLVFVSMIASPYHELQHRPQGHPDRGRLAEPDQLVAGKQPDVPQRHRRVRGSTDAIGAVAAQARFRI